MATKIPMTSSGTDIPAFAYERLARFFLPRIQAYFESEEGQREPAEQESQDVTAPDPANTAA